MEFSIEPAVVVHAVLKGFFYIMLIMVLWTCLRSRVKKLLGKLRQKPPKTIKKDISTDTHTEKQRLSRTQFQQEHFKKAAEYDEKYLKPRQEAKKAQQEKDFYRFFGPLPFEGQGQQLGEEAGASTSSSNGSTNLRRRTGGTSQDAALARKLPENVIEPAVKPEEIKKKQKRVIILPDEPLEDTPECITVAMRGLTDKIRKRRFLKSNQLQVLIDWMEKQGYHSKLYTVCTPYPRRDLSQNAHLTLEEAGLVSDVMVVIEEREELSSDEES